MTLSPEAHLQGCEPRFASIRGAPFGSGKRPFRALVGVNPGLPSSGPKPARTAAEPRPAGLDCVFPRACASRRMTRDRHGSRRASGKSGAGGLPMNLTLSLLLISGAALALLAPLAAGDPTPPTHPSCCAHGCCEACPDGRCKDCPDGCCKPGCCEVCPPDCCAPGCCDDCPEGCTSSCRAKDA